MQIQADDSCLQQFNNLKFKKMDARYIVYKIQKGSERIVVERIGQRAETWDKFLQSLPQNQFRFAVFDFQFRNADNMHVTKIVFINWIPSSSPLKAKVLYATAKQNFKKYLDLNTRDYNITSVDQFTQADMVKQLSK